VTKVPLIGANEFLERLRAHGAIEVRGAELTARRAPNETRRRTAVLWQASPRAAAEGE
jgi:hypothetical protein